MANEKNGTWDRDVSKDFFTSLSHMIFENSSDKTSNMSNLDYVSNLPSNTTPTVTDDITQSLTQLICIMQKDVHGNLGTDDAALLKKNMTKWQEQIKMMREKLKSMS